MGTTSWKGEDWKGYTESRGVTASSSARTLYTSSSVNEKFEPKGINVRESCDSDTHPYSTPIILGLDVTGSMSRVLETVAKRLGVLMAEVYDRLPVTDPQIMVEAFGDTTCDRHPLQVTQFESGIQIAEQLSEVYFEKGGGGNDGESYTLPWYFAARHTKIDSMLKRNKKGFIFTIGDEKYLDTLSRADIKEFIGDDVQADLTAEQILSEVSRQYDVYHLMIEQGSNFSHSTKDKWVNLLGQRAISVSDVEKLPEIIVSILEISAGKSAEDISSSWDSSTSLVVNKAISGLTAVKSTNGVTEF